MSDFTYMGSELELFAHALRWKAYCRTHMEPFLGKRVLEVGAGVGGSTKLLCHGPRERWVCLEPDGRLVERLRSAIHAGEIPSWCEVLTGTLAGLPREQRFDTILYLDVLEHIEDDRGEMERASSYLHPGGHLIVLVPAHGWLFTAFDRAIGHFRRYTRDSLQAAMPKELAMVRCRYLDSIGMFASIANRLILHESMPSLGQVLWWDHRLVPVSRWVDPVFGYHLGKSLMGVWRSLADVDVDRCARL
jgi:SAM-dependent methyltransferase